MGNENRKEQDRDLPLEKHLESNLVKECGHALQSESKRHDHLRTESTVKHHLSLTTKSGISIIQAPGIESPGVFYGSKLPGLPIKICRDIGIAGIDENVFEQFHDSEAEDIYDLYNACNGVIHRGLLDVRKLDELSEEELEVLNVSRLREIWMHTRSGCPTCAGIIDTLNSVRGILSDDEEDIECKQINSTLEDNIDLFL
jgi:hypothetical protein